ncbi:hypothetical protein QBC38DRAFT_270506 [Podospora fimiseda]|uniref:Zn(2)-C6 fungal-type domain-containing protein n=1 Tax=Podospora fimiseda TaxID=252190 RepID=A0AAN7BL00_9PEZI|nr:hypothetical protein QBC38DRAFT_270506 [Podospora fimiseda]
MASRIAAISESAATLPEARSHSPWRRSACDRCRSQKLRCTRKKEDDTTTPCTRCLRIRFPCFTSPAKPPGRLAHRRPTASESPLCTDPSRHPAVAGMPGHTMPVTMPTADSIYVSWPYYQQDGRSTATEDSLLSLSWPTDHHTMNPYNFAVDNTAIMFDAAHSFPGHANPLIDPAVSAMSVAPCSVPEYRIPPSGMEQLHFDSSHYDQSQTLNQNCVLDPGVLLSGLQQSLSKQLYNIKASPQSFSVLNSTAQQMTEDKYAFNPLSLILNSTSELLSISQIFMLPDDVAGSPPPPANLSDYDPVPHTNDDGSIQGSQWPSPVSNPMQYQPSHMPTRYSSASSVASSPASTAVDPALLSSHPNSLGPAVLTSTYLLTLVSCYVQLLSIYDAIFARILVEVNTSSLQPVNYTTVGYNHPAQFKSEYAVNYQRARSIAQMVDQKLDTVEQTLGLPREYYVSSTASSGLRSEQGLLAGTEARAVLGILLGSPRAATGSRPGMPVSSGSAGGLVFESVMNGVGPSSHAGGGLGGDVVVSLRGRIHELLTGGQRG